MTILIGAVSTLFADGWRVEPVKVSPDESMEKARERVKDCIGDEGPVLLIEILHPEKVGLRWFNIKD